MPLQINVKTGKLAGSLTTNSINNIRKKIRKRLDLVKNGVVDHLTGAQNVGGVVSSRISASKKEYVQDAVEEARRLGNAIQSSNFDNDIDVIVEQKQGRLSITIDGSKLESTLERISEEITKRVQLGGGRGPKHDSFKMMYEFYFTERGRSASEGPKGFVFVPISQLRPKQKAKSIYGIGIMVKRKSGSDTIRVEGKDLFTFYVRQSITENRQFLSEIKNVIFSSRTIKSLKQSVDRAFAAQIRKINKRP